MRKKLKEIPKFKSEDEEREFWAKENSTDYLGLPQKPQNQTFWIFSFGNRNGLMLRANAICVLNALFLTILHQ